MFQQNALNSQIWNLFLITIILKMMKVYKNQVLLYLSSLISNIQNLVFVKIQLEQKVHQTQVLHQQSALISYTYFLILGGIKLVMKVHQAQVLLQQIVLNFQYQILISNIMKWIQDTTNQLKSVVNQKDQFIFI
ncbi:hypothetical protein TTHERM_000264927 (macronuclear) [Tetrahymena thermophila SB210]|uniref:Uncharacterized protein n=1 Tax=Tetrahymena thermophila (strain SB210) TaxID=312017 RepID=W7XK13_TETTS|nr:hypothetical protein TTHERM_000264927 [Tetrahymena thermophila SB210]EWS76126.1 hypothetical protein TTHERM_000264927 [Tetrahymena thermophila SB210]|eukprot:XP_012651366.1 hypothetical protein TTHERM_000264927 [Tetrahymena thermophila SB210]